MKTAMRMALVVVVAGLLVSGAQAIDAKDLVGVWVCEKQQGDLPKGAELEFTKDGKMTMKAEVEGKKVEHKATYKLTGDKLEFTSTDPNGKEHTEMATIKEVTKDKLVVITKDKKEMEFKKK